MTNVSDTIIMITNLHTISSINNVHLNFAHPSKSRFNQCYSEEQAYLFGLYILQITIGWSALPYCAKKQFSGLANFLNLAGLPYILEC